VTRTRETAPLALLALVAFASNSILTRMALGRGAMDAASFTTVRLVAGAVALALLVRVQAGSWAPLRSPGGSVRARVVGPLSLFVYAAPFSFAYLRIGAAAGALLLFGAVQLTMIGWGIVGGERPRPRTWVALAIAAGGLAWLTLPSVGRPDPVGSALMVVAGCAWGVYSLAGRRAAHALGANARSFAWAVPLALLLGVAARAPAARVVMSPRGIALGIVSGALTSGVGYAIWYRALRGLTAAQAAILQLGVPVIAAFGAVAILGEAVSPRLAVSGLAVIGGIGLVLSERATRR